MTQKTSVILLTHLLIPPILRSHSPLQHSTHVWKQNSLRYPISVPLLHHHTSAIITDCNCSTMLSPWLDLPGFWPGTETKRDVWLFRTGFGVAPVNKLVSLTWLLWSLKSFWRFTWSLSVFVGLLVPQSRTTIALNRAYASVEVEPDITRHRFWAFYHLSWIRVYVWKCILYTSHVSIAK